MCGICGIYSLPQRKNIPKTKIEKMNQQMEHRGPDASGTFIGEGIGLGSTRLKILDLSDKANQPLSNEDETLWLVFKGEIYNFKEIYSNLQHKHKFKTSSDTEVIIHSFEEKGVKQISNFNGMFSFAIWNKPQDELFLFRDRLGIKPLFYTKIDSSLIFASSVASILTNRNVPRKPNIRAISSYLSFRRPLAEETFFEGIYSLPPGSFLKATRTGIKIQRYWDIPVRRSQKTASIEKYKQLLHIKMRESVRNRLISDVPICVFLSGGLDSSIIAYLVQDIMNKKINTYTVRLKDYNETYYANVVAEHISSEHTEVSVKPEEYLSMMDKLITHRGEPLGVPNEVLIYAMAKEIKKKAAVVLSGEGADELFGGYGRIYRSSSDFQRMNIRLPKFLKRFIFRNIYKAYGNKSFENKVNHFLEKYQYTPTEYKKTLFVEKIWKENLNEDKFIQDYFKNLFETIAILPYSKQIEYIFEHFHLPVLLARLDNATMLASVEGRVPFVDHELVEFALNISNNHKLKWNSVFARIKSIFLSSNKISEKYDTTKYLLRETYRNQLPNEIIDRKKVGFPVPINNILDSMGGKQFLKHLLLNDSFLNQIFNKKQISKLIENTDNKKSLITLWMLINIKMWSDIFIEKGTK